MQSNTEGFVALFDILGYKEWVNNTKLDNVVSVYKKMKRVIETQTSGYINHVLNKPIITTFCFSDSFLIYTNEATDAGFEALLMACRFVFESACSHKRPIRGAITVGEFYASEGMVIGKPIIEAYETERKQEWLGCQIQKECKNKVQETFAKYLTCNTIVEFPIPLKKGAVNTLYAYNWVKELTENTAFTIDDLETRLLWSENSHGWKEERKHKNTKEFINFVLL